MNVVLVFAILVFVTSGIHCQSVVSTGHAWGEWGQWSPCSATCGRGRMIRIRECKPNNVCLGTGLETERCFININCDAATTTATTSTTQTPPATTLTSTTTTTPITRRYCSRQAILRTLGAVDASDCKIDQSVVSFELIGPDMKLPVCSGVLISPNHVLTTRRCTASITDTLAFPDISWRAITGSVTDGRQIQEIGEVNVFPSETIEGGDLAIVIIPGGFTEDTCTAPACLPLATDIYETGQSCRIAGWSAEGPPETATLEVPSNRQTANVTFVSTSVCEYIYSYLPDSIRTNYSVYADTVCTHAIEDGAAVCGTDEGWSLFCNDGNSQSTLVGLAMTYITSVCSTDRPSRFQSVQKHLDWITDILETPLPTTPANPTTVTATTMPTPETTTTIATTTPLSRKYCNKPVATRALGAVDVNDCRTDPSVVSFELTGPGMKLPVCSGVLISPNHVLTTRRCSDGITETSTIPDVSWRAIAGSVTDGTQIQDVGEVHVLQNDATGGGDLAIVNIPGGFVEDACAAPVCLPLASDIYETGHTCRITGWSSEDQTDLTTLVIPSNHQTANVTLISSSDCEYIYSYLPDSIRTNHPVFADTVCTHAIGDQVAVCEKDEGWSLFCTDGNNQSTLLGLAMTDTNTDCSTGRPSRFQSVQMHLDWITDMLSVA